MPHKPNPILLTYFVTLILISLEPAYANKFETIGSGVSGSVKIKVEYLKTITYVTGAIMFIAGVLSIALREKNAQFLNYTMWKPSSIVFFLLGSIAIGLGLYL